MEVLICIIVGIIALVIGFIFGRSRGSDVSLNLVERINFVMGTENKTLKERNEDLEKKIFFFKEWLVRSYIEQYYRKKLAAGDHHQIYTVDALEDLRDYAKEALNNFEKIWNSKSCKEQCSWIKEYLEELISKIDSILNDEWANDVFDSENEKAFIRFFAGVQTNLFCDRSAKKNGMKTEELTYWHPQVK